MRKFTDEARRANSAVRRCGRYASFRDRQVAAHCQSAEYQGGVRPSTVRRVRRAVGAVVVAGILLASPAPAQQPRGEVSCGSNGGAPSPEATISACTAAIESGRMPPQNIALAYNNRGIAHADKGDLDRAITDYSAAIRLDPGLAIAYNNRGLVHADKG